MDPPRGTHDRAAARLLLALAALSTLIYLALALIGDLRGHPGPLLAAEAVLLASMGTAWVRMRSAHGGYKIVIVAALVFRVVAAFGEPALSDDVYRYVWDGRVQLHGSHPYAHAPDEPALRPLRDADWEKINHRHLGTIYPPLSQLMFVVLAATGAGPFGFKLVLGLIDFGVVLALARLLRTLGLPRDRLVLYAWNPLAVLETAGSGHVEPLGVALVILGAVWIIDRRPGWAAVAIAAASQVKILPAALFPGYLRRFRVREILLLVAVLVALALPYALTGPAVGPGLWEYAEHWEFNSSVYAGARDLLASLDSGNALKPAIGWLQNLPGSRLVAWDAVYRLVWPNPLARIIVILTAVIWIAILTFRPGLDAARESFLVLAGLVVLSPTVHPWYVLWVLPFAAAYLSWPWLVFGALVVLSYLGPAGEVFGWVRWLEYGGLVVAAGVTRAWRVRRQGIMSA